ncbi:CAP-Gly domain-containing linker protein 1-like isoform X2 [Leptotrombidium deliense]|uniref:CAP-Gly domain-containing linker protein 1-like isoform X2 n=1 Tax=Leptotrombidium deliense TaxID=299467 RepID=A0A443SIW2_9ACAR|nr:CAP-Gly domain-containing linker protein 1-like isoform X2 [Leptotrombidium deliense]
MSSKKAVSSVDGKSKPRLSSRVRVASCGTRSSLNSSVSSLTSDCSEKGITKRNTSSATVVLNEKCDELKVGDRVFVDGELPGVIRFIDYTNFASGKWAGVELDDEAGKNDGSVNGVRYFQCKPKYGLFIRPERATFRPLSPHSSDELLLLLFSDEFENESLSSSTNSVPKSVSPQMKASNLKVGDKVLVNTSTGIKEGTLKFLGETKFAAGVWAGIELDDCHGKNNGSVAGVRYFDCQPNHGLFVHINKVSKAAQQIECIEKIENGAEEITEAKPPLQRQHSNTATYQKAKHGDLLTARLTGLSGSIESLNSIANKESQRSDGSKGVEMVTSTDENVVQNNLFDDSSESPFCETLNEKEEQICNLLNERESVRSETALKIGELEQELTSLKIQYDNILQEKVNEIQELKDAVDEGNRVHKELLLQVNEERRRVEVVEYRLEEEMLCSLKIKEKLDKMVNEKNGQKTDQHNEFMRKTERIFQLESSLESKKQEVLSLQGRIREVEEQCKIAERKQMRYLETIDELNLKIAKSDADARKVETVREQLEEELQQLREDLVTLKNKLSKKDEFLDLPDKLRRKDSEIADLSVNVNSLRKQLELLKDEKSTLQEERNMSEKLLHDKTVEINNFKRMNSELQERLDETEKQKKDLELQLIELSRIKRCNESELNLLRRDTSEKEKKIQQLIESSKRKDDEIYKLNEDYLKKISEKDEELKAFKICEHQLREYIVKSDEEKRKWQQQVESMYKSNKSLSTKEECHESEDQTLADELRSLNSQLSKMESDLLRYSEEASDLTVLITKKNEEIETLNRGKQDSTSFDTNDRLVSSLQENIKDLQSENRVLTEQIGNKEKNILDLQERVDDLNRELKMKEAESSGNLQQSTKCLLSKKERELSEFLNIRNVDNEQTQELLKQILLLKEANNELVKERDKMSVECLNQKNGVVEKEETIKKLRQQLDSVRKQLDDCRKKVTEKSKSDTQSINEELTTKAQNLQREIEVLRLNNSDLNKEIVKIRDELNLVSERYRETLVQFESECKRLEKIISEKNMLLEKKELCLKQITVESESSIESIKKKMETEKDKLIQKISALESSLTEQSVSTKSLHSQKGAEKETYESQIDFLNSVIVDMQKKNDDLKARVQILEEIGVTDFGEQFAVRNVNGRPRTQRIFCEICDVFDTHYTQDCPLQSGQLQDLNPHFIHQILRPERPVCRTCRGVGHWTDACTNNRVF